MKDQQSHITLAVIVGLAYVFLGYAFLGVHPEHLVLAAVLVVCAAMLPDIDASEGTPAREAGSILAAVSPLIVLQYFPSLQVGGVARIVLVVIISYVLTRVYVVRTLQKHTSRFGMFHSIPAAIIAFEATYLVFWDMFWLDRTYIAAAALVGFMSHLMFDAYMNFDLVGTATGKGKKQVSALKLWSSSIGANFVTYGIALYLGWFVFGDIYRSVSA